MKPKIRKWRGEFELLDKSYKIFHFPYYSQTLIKGFIRKMLRLAEREAPGLKFRNLKIRRVEIGKLGKERR